MAEEPGNAELGIRPLRPDSDHQQESRGDTKYQDDPAAQGMGLVDRLRISWAVQGPIEHGHDSCTESKNCYRMYRSPRAKAHRHPRDHQGVLEDPCMHFEAACTALGDGCETS